MATLTKRGDGWRAQVRRRGFPAESRTFPGKGQARAWATQREAEMQAGVRRGSPRITVADLFDRYSREEAPKRRGRRWEEVRLVLLGRSDLAAVTLADLSPAHVAAFRDARARSVGAGTVRRELALLGAVFEVARREWGLIQANPCRDVKKPPPPKHRERLISADEEAALLAALDWREATPTKVDQQIAAALILALETGMRQGEILGGLRWDRISGRVATLERTKNGDARQVPLSNRAAAVLELMRGLDPFRPFTVKPGTFDTMFREARKRAGIDGLTFHDSRATAITRLAKRLDLLELARVSGHRDPRSLMVYYRESAESLAKRLD